MYLVPTGPVIRRRLAFFLVAVTVLFTVLTARLFSLQVVQAEDLQRRAQSQWTSKSVVAPTRGTIYDRNGATLAMSATAYTVSASPRQIRDTAAFARILAPILDMEEVEIAQKVSDRSKGGVTIKRQIPRETAQAINTLIAELAQRGDTTLSGLYLEEESKRYYPMGAFATQLIGLTTIDGVGQAGLESSLNDYLTGKSGVVLREIDGKGRELAYSGSEYVPAVDGGYAVLTIDASIQSFAERAAREALEINHAQGVRVLVMNPKTGEILAMVSKPDYDLNEPPRNDVQLLTERMRNTVIADAYEPGSTFKILTMASALDAGVTNVNEGFYCSGSVKVDGGKIRCWGEPHGAESAAQALENSCNPVFVELGLRLGTDRFYDYLEAFGIGSKTGVDIPGEGSGIVIPRTRVKRVDLARIGFGQSVAVTQLQLLNAACAAINGGNLMRPYVVSEVYSGDGRLIRKTEPQVVGHPISEKTSQTMRTLLEGVVKNGGGRNAYLEGFRVGGKTGTAQVYIDGVVSSDTHIGSFVGFAPMDDPQIAVMVVVDRADVASDFGSVTAAPFARDILERSLNYLGIAPYTEEKLSTVTVPDVRGLSATEARTVLKENGLTAVLSGEGEKVVDQLPAAGATMQEGSIAMLYVEGAVEALNTTVRVPDITGLSVVEANRLIRAYGLRMVAEGSGIAVLQMPMAGEEVTCSSLVTVVFEPPNTE